ncbi:MAG TPA: FtsX-like permease family protein, partial [Blastocatellia bacterium]|nr:FtsX-like permease family protein [Blastocatellia bacterium]
RHTSSSRRTRLGKSLIPVQIALSLILVAVAGLFVASLARLLYNSTGMREDGVYMARTNLERLPEKGEQLDALYLRMLDYLREEPGVQSASLVLHQPMTDSGEGSHFISRERSGAVHEDNFEHAAVNAVGPGFFETVGIGRVAGRDFAETDSSRSPGVCILSESAARFFFPNSSPIGGRIEAPEGVARLKTASYDVVGVVGDAKYDTLHEDAPPTVYLPFTQEAEQISPGGNTLSPHMDLSFMIRGADRNLIQSAYRATMRKFAPDSPVFDLVSLCDKMLQTISADRLVASLSAFLGILALLLTCISLYGQVAWSVCERRSEIGIRIALGATRRKIVRMIVGGVIVPTGIGTVVGLGGAIAISRILRNLIYNTRPASPALIVGSIGSLLLVAAIASFLPARRAASVDPMKSLRME